MSGTAKLYSIGPLGNVLAITPQKTESAAVAKSHTTVVLDVSGSMGPWVAHARLAIQSALLQIGYDKNDQIALITFTTNPVRVLVDGRDPTIGELTTRLKYIVSQASTNMSGAILLLAEVLRAKPKISHQILVISDGEIQDSEMTVKNATDMSKTLSNFEAPISATLLRLKTSSNAQPDTRALACVGSFCNQSTATVTDVDVWERHQEEVGLLSLTDAIVAGFGHSAHSSVDLIVEQPILKRFPFDQGLCKLRLYGNGSTTFLLVDSSLNSVRLDDVIVPVQNAGPLEREEVLNPFFELVEQQLKMWQLMGSRENDVRVIVKWAEDLQNVLKTFHVEAVESLDIATLARAKAVRAAIKKRTGSILDRIRRLGNADRVDNLNAQQQADWLRGVQNTKSGRALARRAMNGDEEVDYAGRAQNAILALSQKTIPEPSDLDLPRSFYSLCTSTDYLRSAFELADVAQDLNVGEVLQCVGMVGVPFQAFAGDFPDPFSLRIKVVYEGQSLSESDVWLGYAHGENGTTSLKCPGRGEDATITGVIGLREADPDAYNLFTSADVRPIFEMQASCQIRRVIAPVPYDAIALNAAGAWFFITALGRDRTLSTIQRKTMGAIVDNLRHLIGSVYNQNVFKELYESMVNNADARPWLSGDRDVGGILRPIAVLLRYFDAQEAHDRLPHILRSLYYLDCYHAAKKKLRQEDGSSAQERQRLLHDVLGIDLQTRGTPLQPLFVAEPEKPNHYSEVSVDEMSSRLPKFFPKLEAFLGLDAVLQNRTAPADPVTVFGVHLKTLHVVACIQALLCPNQSDRIDTETRTSLIPDPVTEEDAIAYLRKNVHDIYANDYGKRLESKKRQEEVILLEQLVQQLVTVGTYHEFRTILLASQIVNRQHEGYEMLLKRLMSENCPALLEKLSLLISGRDVEKPEVAVWCNGNFHTGNWQPLAEVIEKLEGGADRMHLLRQIRKQYGLHTYRGGDAGKANSHGHGNHFPSYWALGYKDLYDMRASVSGAEFASYFKAHCLTKGCCIPVKRKDFGL